MGNTIAEGLRFAAARGTASADNADYLAPVSIRECEVAATEIDNLTADRDRLRAEVERWKKSGERVSHWAQQYIMAVECECGPQPKFGQGIVGSLHSAIQGFNEAARVANAQAGGEGGEHGS